MARRKLPESETPHETYVRKVKERVSGISDRSEKVAWLRKKTNMEALITELDEVNEKIRELKVISTPIVLKIDTLRADMVTDCIHPFDMLAYNESLDVVECKFCSCRFAMPKHVADQETLDDDETIEVI